MNTKTATILVVDDEANNRNVVAAQLKSEGYAIISAASGEEALRLVDKQLPDLILLDVMMPGISGFDVAEILKCEERTSAIPIIMLTALGDSNARLSALNFGAEEFLTKPVAKAELLARIRNLLKLKHHHDRLSQDKHLLEDKVTEQTEELKAATQQLGEAQYRLLQSEKLAALGQLAAGVAHEINNPIGYVKSNLGTLRDYLEKMIQMLNAYDAFDVSQACAPATRVRLDQLKKELELDYLSQDAPVLIEESIAGIGRVRKIVQDLKNFSRAGGNDEWQMADLHEGLNSALNIANNEIKYKATVVKHYGELPQIECLPSQLDQVFLNLLVNAAQAIPESTPGTITVSTGTRADQVWIEISDTGQGIAAENLPRIFDPFFTTKPVGLGTGLGLSLSYGIIEKHGGRIEVNSEIGRGTTFRIYVPIRHVHVAADSTETK